MFYFYQNSAIWLYSFKALLVVAFFSLSGCSTPSGGCKHGEVDSAIKSLRCLGEMKKYNEDLELAIEKSNSEKELMKDETRALQQQSMELSQDINLYQDYIADNLKMIQEDEVTLANIKITNLVMQEKKLSIKNNLASMKAKFKQERTKNAASREEINELIREVKQYREAIDDFYKTIVE